MILVTGGAGFIGSNLSAALVARGERVIICDRLGNEGKWRNIQAIDFDDILPPEELREFLATPPADLTAIVHLGAISDTTETDADALIETNFRLSKHLWVFCAAYDKRFVYASSAATYGDGAAGFDDDGSIEYLARLRPLNAYGWSKHVFDRWVARQVRDRSPVPNWAGLKFFNAYGPNEAHKGAQASVISKLSPQVSSGKPLKLFQSHRQGIPDGGQMRDFIWVGDCVDVMTWLLDTPTVSGLFNAGTGAARTFADLAEILFAADQREPEVEYIPTPLEIRDSYQYRTEARIDRLRQAGYARPFTTLEEGVRQFLSRNDD